MKKLITQCENIDASNVFIDDVIGQLTAARAKYGPTAYVVLGDEEMWVSYERPETEAERETRVVSQRAKVEKLESRAAEYDENAMAKIEASYNAWHAGRSSG